MDTNANPEASVLMVPPGSGAGVLNVFIPGGFETNMPAIVEWFRTRG